MTENAPSQYPISTIGGTPPIAIDAKPVDGNFAQVLSGLVRRGGGWPNWGGPPSSDGHQVDFIVQMDDDVYRKLESVADPRVLFEKARAYLQDIHVLVNTISEMDHFEKNMIEQLCSAVFGSNLIERTGLNLEQTFKLCEAVFQGDRVDATDVEERQSEYEAQLDAMMDKRKGRDRSHVIRARREVLQHAQAFQHIITAVVIDNQPWSEDLILSTHRILCENIDIDGGAAADIYAGKYRRIHVGAGNCGFVPPAQVPKLMKRLVGDLNNDIEVAESSQKIDPFSLASKYCQEFVMIHPFVDGNGRTCRLILNALLLKYVGVVVSLGEHEDARVEYLGVARRAGEEMEGYGELATLVLSKATVRLRNLKKKLRGKSHGD